MEAGHQQVVHFLSSFAAEEGVCGKLAAVSFLSFYETWRDCTLAFGEYIPIPSRDDPPPRALNSCRNFLDKSCLPKPLIIAYYFQQKRLPFFCYGQMDRLLAVELTARSINFQERDGVV